MSWIDLAWPTMAGICFTLGLIHLDIGVRSRTNLVHLLFSVICMCAGTIAFMELVAMRTAAAEDFARILRWGHVPMGVLIIAVVWFIRLAFAAGDKRLGLAISALYAIALIANFTSGDNLHFRETTDLAQVQLWGGESVSTPLGVGNPWMSMVMASLLLLVVYLGQVIVQVWRRGNPRERIRVVAICGSLQVFTLVAAILAFATVWLGQALPISINPGFVPVLFVMSMDLGGDILRAAQLAQRLKASDASLRVSQLRTSLAVRAADIGLWGWDAGHGERWMSDVSLRLLDLRNPDTFRLRNLLHRVHPEDRTQLLSTLAAALRDQGEFKAEFRLNVGQRMSRWLGIRGQVEEHAAGGRPRLSGVLVDITERKAADSRFQQVVEAAPTAMLMANRDGHVVLANHKAQEVFGMDRELLAHATLETLLPPPPGGSGQGDAWARFLDDESVVSSTDLPHVARRQGGSDFPVELAASRVRIADESFCWFRSPTSANASAWSASRPCGATSSCTSPASRCSRNCLDPWPTSSTNRSPRSSATPRQASASWRSLLPTWKRSRKAWSTSWRTTSALARSSADCARCCARRPPITGSWKSTRSSRMSCGSSAATCSTGTSRSSWTSPRTCRWSTGTACSCSRSC
jgi:PAS domain S-box-containing protein